MPYRISAVRFNFEADGSDSQHLTAVLALLSWMLKCSIALVPVALPSEPCRWLLSLPFPALMAMLRMMDACMDWSFLRVLAVQVCTVGCFVVGLSANIIATVNAPERLQCSSDQ